MRFKPFAAGSGLLAVALHFGIAQADTNVITGDAVEILTPVTGSTEVGLTTLTGSALKADDIDDINGDGWVVIAVVDTGINPYNPDFAAVAGQPTTHPSEWIEGFPANALPIDLTCAADTNIMASCASDFSSVQQNEWYWIPGTKIIGAISTDQSGADFAPTPILDNHGHGTHSASVAAGNVYGSCSNCLIVVVEGFDVDKAYQPWIDIVTNSWGRIANAGGATTLTDNFVFGSAAEHDITRDFTENGGSSLWAAGNGAANAFVVPISTYTAPHTGADWHYVVGAVGTGTGGMDENQEGEQSIIGSGKPVLTSSYGSGIIPASCHDSNELNCSHSGTSSATPITAGVMGSILMAAKDLLGDHTEGYEGNGIAGAGAPVDGNQWLADGQLSRAELWALTAKTARPMDYGWVGFPVTYGDDQNTNPLLTGYGIVNRWSRDDAIAILSTGSNLPDRSDIDAFIEQDSEYRVSLWGSWAETKFGGITTAPPAEAAAPASAAAVSSPDQALAAIEAYAAENFGTRVAGTDASASQSTENIELGNSESNVFFAENSGLGLTAGTPLDASHYHELVLSSESDVTITLTWTASLTDAGASDLDLYATGAAEGSSANANVVEPLGTGPGETLALEDVPAGKLVLQVLPYQIADPDRVTYTLTAEVTGKTYPDTDGDGITDDIDACPTVPAPGTIDGCPVLSNEGTVSFTVNGADAGSSTVTNGEWAHAINIDTFAADANSEFVVVASFETANDTVLLLKDTDKDSVADTQDNCVGASNADQTDIDNDGAGDACDGDMDGDGVSNANDAFPRDRSEWNDTDGDGIGDNSDDDIDGDGKTNARDGDMDGDGFSNGQENAFGTDPRDPASHP